MIFFFLLLQKKQTKKTRRVAVCVCVFMASVNCENETSDSIKSEEVQHFAPGRDSLLENAAAALRPR